MSTSRTTARRSPGGAPVVQRIHAELHQLGVTLPERSIRWAKTRELLEDDSLEISPAGRQRVLTAYRMIDAITIESRPLEADLQRFGRRQPGCRALVEHQYGIGGLLAVVLWSELGDCQRFARSEQVVRHSGLDVTVDQSDRRCAGGFISRQGPQTLHWALYEAAKNASHQRSPDHHYYADVKDHLNGTLATISMARKLARRCFHVLWVVDPTRSTQRTEYSRRGWWAAPPTHTSRVVSRSAPATGVPASIRAGRP